MKKVLIPFVYLRLAQRFSFDDVKRSFVQSRSGQRQFSVIQREAYDAVGGHAAITAQSSKMFALARRVKSAGFRIWFASGFRVVRVRMYRSFSAMWEAGKRTSSN